VFLAIGKQNLAIFAQKPQHHYVLRLIDPPDTVLPLPDICVILARGPFTYADDLALITQHRISHIVAKNAGGPGAQAKLEAARHARIPIVMIDRPALPVRHCVHEIAEVLAALGLHDLPTAKPTPAKPTTAKPPEAKPPGTERGV
jgi:precorrin-6A/cobalt-precorrin-6A reductase